MRGRGAAWVLALVLLAGCAPAPAAEPPEEPEVRVRTHWGALETRAGALPDGETPRALIHISEPTRQGMISYAVFCLKKKKKKKIKKIKKRGHFSSTQTSSYRTPMPK